MKSKNNVVESYNSELVLFNNLVDSLKVLLENHSPKDLSLLHWGYVGDLVNVNDSLTDIISTLSGEDR